MFEFDLTPEPTSKKTKAELFIECEKRHKIKGLRPLEPEYYDQGWVDKIGNEEDWAGQ